jgi:hypothetical protein
MTRLFRDLLVTTAALTASTDAFGSAQPQQRTFLTRFTTVEECIETICSQEYYDTVFRTTNVDAGDISYSPDPSNTYHATPTNPQRITYRRRPTLAGFPAPIPKLNFCETWCRMCAEEDTHDKLSVHVNTDMMRFAVDMSFFESRDGVVVTLDGTWESGLGVIAPFFGQIVNQMQDTMGTILGKN